MHRLRSGPTLSQTKLLDNYYVSATMENEKKEIDYVEKAYDVSPTRTDDHPEQDWTAEEERAVVYVSCTT